MNTRLATLLGVFALALAFTASPVLAAQVDVSTENIQTGADSENENETNVENDVDVDVENNAGCDRHGRGRHGHGHERCGVVNEVDADVNTGDNEQNKNTEAGGIDTGSVDASTDWESVVNAGAAFAGADMYGDLDVTATFTNDTTGAESENENELDVDNDVDIDLENSAYILNELGLDANTGDNEQNKNTTAGDTATGDISLDALISNFANNGSGFAGASGGLTSVDVAADNTMTGYDSENENEVNVENDFDLDVENKAKIKNEIDVDANTGDNEQNKNTTGGSIDTGDIAVATDILNSANNGSSAAGAGSNGLDVEVDATNDTTGAESENENEVNVENDTDIDVENKAEIKNEIDVDANTGDNEQNKNTSGGDTLTGNVTLDFVVTNEVNSN